LFDSANGRYYFDRRDGGCLQHAFAWVLLGDREYAHHQASIDNNPIYCDLQRAIDTANFVSSMVGSNCGVWPEFIFKRVAEG